MAFGGRIFYVVPCGAEKVTGSAKVRDLYVGGMFRYCLDAVQATAAGQDATILVLSAKYGLVGLDDVVDSYDVKMGDAGSVTVDQLADQAAALGMTWGCDVYAFLPKRYFAALDEALRRDDVYAADVYEADAGIGYQRGTLRCVRQYV